MTQISFQFEQLLTSTFCKLCHFISKGHEFKMTNKRKRKGNTLAHIMPCLYCSDLDDKIQWTKKSRILEDKVGFTCMS
jgi:hypothetical protein